MYQNFIFSETQKFRQPWLWIGIILCNTLFVFKVLDSFFSEQRLPDSQPGIPFILISLVSLSIVNTIFVISRLDTGLNEIGVYYRFYPFQFQFRRIEWDRISKAYIKKYSPILEYGGWGIRYGLHGKAFNVSGNMGLQLEYDNGRKFLLGTKHPDEIITALKSIGHKATEQERLPN